MLRVTTVVMDTYEQSQFDLRVVTCVLGDYGCHGCMRTVVTGRVL